MRAEELTNFIEIWESLWEMYRTPNSPAKPSDIMIKMTFSALQEYSLEQINHAVMKHIQCEKWMPKPADIIKHIEGGDLTPDEIIAQARLKQNPCGVMAAIHIGSWDLENQESFYLRQRAQEVLILLPEWKQRAQRGEYTDHEISTLLKYEVNVAKPFLEGLPAPENIARTNDRAARIALSPKHIQRLEELKEEPQSVNEAGIMRIAKIIGGEGE